MDDADDLTRAYVPRVVYFHDGNAVEYVTDDAVALYERIDANLDIVRDAETKNIIGMRLNWWSVHQSDLRKQGATVGDLRRPERKPNDKCPSVPA